MPFGLTYGAFVAGIGLSMFFGPLDTTAPPSSRAMSFGTEVVPWTKGTEIFVTFTQIGDQVIWHRFHPIYALGLSDQGAAYISVGLGRRLDVFGIKIMPFMGPTLYLDNRANDLLQFRTGFEISKSLGENLSLTGGFYHISNGQANAASADIDVAHVGLSLLF
jgi:hypothetical protein